jgi:hypothetical protein
MEVWMQNHSAGAAGSYKYNVSLDGTNYNVYEGSGSWPIISFVNTDGTESSKSVNIMDFAKNAASHGMLSSSEYLLNVDYGSEVYYGSGSWDGSSYSAP